MTCRLCGGRGYVVLGTHAFEQDGAVQYETVEVSCSCAEGPDYSDLEGQPDTAIGGPADVIGTIDGGDVGECELYGRHLAQREAECRALRMRQRVAAMRGVWRG